MHYVRRITGAAAFFALAVLWSKLWGQFRESLQMGLFSGPAIAAYLTAVKIPFEAPQVISTALSAAMVPVLVDLCKQGRSAEAKRVAGGIVMVVGLVLAPLALVGALFSEPILRNFWNDQNPVVLEQARQLSLLLFPYLVISSISGAMAAMLQAFKQFRPLAIGQLIPNVIIVTCVLVLHRRMGIISQGLGVVLGGAAYFLLIYWNYHKLRASPQNTERNSHLPWWKLPSLSAIGWAMVPLLLIGLADWGGSQLAVFHAVSSWVQETDSTALKNFQSAYQILQIPQGIFVAALSMVLLPFLSGFAASNDRDGMASAAAEGIRMVLYTVAPTVVLIACLALPILHVLFRHGQYLERSAVHSAPLIATMAPYVLFSSVAEVLILCLLAMKKVWPLLLVQLLSLLAAGCLSYVGAMRMGLPGIALAVTLIAALNLSLLFWAVEHYIQLKDWQETGRFLWKLGTACAGLWLWMTILKRAFEGSSGVQGVSHNLLEIVIAVTVSAVIYIGISEWLRIPEWLLLRSSIERVLSDRRHPSIADEPAGQQIEILPASHLAEDKHAE